jgi:hypothetical protein
VKWAVVTRMLPGVALSLPRTEIAELVVLVFGVTLPTIGLAKKTTQRKVDSLPPACQPVLAYDRLDNVVVDLDLDRRQHGPTIPTAFRLGTGERPRSKSGAGLGWGWVLGEP